jgi:hypothetical protein
MGAGQLRNRILAFVVAGALASCGDDGGNTGDDTPDDVIPEGPRYEGCTKLIAAGSDYEAVQTTFIEAKTGDVLCFADGTYAFANELSLTVNKVTVRGNPADREKVVLDYTNQQEGKDALSVSGSDFTIEHLTVKNSRGNSIVVKGAERPTFRNLKVYWDAGSVTENGADDALVTGNRTYDNTAGILVFVMPNLEKTDGARTIVENNIITDNNRKNFGEPGTTVSFVPQGLGLLLLANDGTEVRSNTIEDNGSTGVLAVSFSTYEFMCRAGGGDNCGASDGDTDPDASKTYIHDNTFARNGTAPDPGLVPLFRGVDVIEDVLWDGRLPELAQEEDQFCLGPNPAKVRVIGDQTGIFLVRTVDVTDGSLFSCTLPPLFDSLELPQDE